MPTTPTGPLAPNLRFRALYRFATGAWSDGQARAEDAARDITAAWRAQTNRAVVLGDATFPERGGTANLVQPVRFSAIDIKTGNALESTTWEHYLEPLRSIKLGPLGIYDPAELVSVTLLTSNNASAADRAAAVDLATATDRAHSTTLTDALTTGYHIGVVILVLAIIVLLLLKFRGKL